MKNVSKYFKIWLAVTLAIIVAGIALFAVLGLNKSANVGKSYEVQVEVAVVTENNAEKLKTTSVDYLNGKGMSVISVQEVGDGEKLLIKVSNVDSKKVNEIKTGLAQAVEKALNSNELKATVGIYESQDSTAESFVYFGIAFAVIAVVIFVYYAFMEKVSGALSVLISMAISAAMYIAMAALCRAPVDPYFGSGITFATALAGVLAGGIVNRCRELIKNVGNDKKSFKEIADEATWQSVTRFAALIGAILVASILLIALGSAMVKFIAIHAVIATVASAFASFVWTGFFWGIFKKFKKNKKYKATEKAKTEN